MSKLASLRPDKLVEWKSASLRSGVTWLPSEPFGPALASTISKSQFTDSELPELFERLHKQPLKITSLISPKLSSRLQATLKIWKFDFIMVLPPKMEEIPEDGEPKRWNHHPNLPPKNFASKIWGFLLRFQWHQRPRFDGSYPEHRRATTTGTHEVRTKGQQD